MRTYTTESERIPGHAERIAKLQKHYSGLGKLTSKYGCPADNKPVWRFKDGRHDMEFQSVVAAAQSIGVLRQVVNRAIESGRTLRGFEWDWKP